MQLNFAPSQMMNAAGAFFFAIEGLAILLLSRGSRRGILIGGLALSFGLTYIASNLLFGPEYGWVIGLCGTTTALFALLLAHDLARGIRADLRRPFAAYFVVAGVIALFALGILVRSQIGNGPVATFAVVGLVWPPVAIAILLAAGAANLASLPENSTERNGLASLILAFGLFAMFLAPRIATVQSVGATGESTDLGSFALGLLTVVLIPVFAALTAGPRPRIPRRIWIAFLAASFAGLALVVVMEPPYQNEFGAYGIVRTIGAALLARAIVKHDLLGVPLPRLATKRGALATGALATLIIVAQIAQNFLSAQYGLIMGGIVAGALVFAASPIQRAIERSREPARISADAGARGEASYRKAVRRALRDKVLTRQEQGELHELARDLGIDGVRAHEIMVEFEAEREHEG